MKVKPFQGKYVSRIKAKQVNNMLLSTKRPERTALKKEAEEFIEYIKAMYEEKI